MIKVFFLDVFFYSSILYGKRLNRFMLVSVIVTIFVIFKSRLRLRQLVSLGLKTKGFYKLLYARPILDPFLYL